MNIKRVISFLLLICLNVQASEMYCAPSSDSNQSCQIVSSPEEFSSNCSSNSKYKNPDIANAMGVDPDAPIACDDFDLMGGESFDKKKLRKAKRKLKKQCRKKAKQYKKAVLKELMKQKKFGQALKVLLKRKRFSAEYSKGKSNTNKIDLTGMDLENVSKEDLNNHVMNELNKLYPGLKDQAADFMTNDPSFKYGFHENENIPVNILIQDKGKNSCKLSLDQLPKAEKFKPRNCEYCNNTKMDAHFENDCSYMTSKSLSDDEAQEMMGVSNKKDYCQIDDMDSRQSDMGEIDKVADELCNVATEGLSPDYSIQTSRNQYNDYTPELAQKRGKFIQKYLRKKIAKDCELDVLPDWLQSDDEFQSKVRLSHPKYIGNKEGDYGPSPYASTKKEQDLEIDKLKQTLEMERTEIESKVVEIDKKIEELNKRIQSAYKDINKSTKTYNANRAQIKKLREIKNIGEMENDIQNNVGHIYDLRDKVNNYKQQIHDLNQQKTSYNQQVKSDYSSSKIQSKVNLLGSYYNDRNANGGSLSPAEKKNWDKKLFNDFKMVRIQGKALPNDESETLYNPEVMPQLSVMLNMMTKVDQYACVVEPHSTKRTTVGGILKGFMKVGMAITLPGVIVGGIALAAPLAIFNNIASIFCHGCNKPGNVPPKWRMVGNLFSLNKNKNARKNFWKTTGGVIKDYVTWGGALDKGKRQVTRTYNDFDKYAKNYYGDEYDSKTAHRSSERITVDESYDSKGNLLSSEVQDENGIVIEKVDFGYISKKQKRKYNQYVKIQKDKNFTVTEGKTPSGQRKVVVKDSEGKVVEVYDEEANIIRTYTRYDKDGRKINN